MSPKGIGGGGALVVPRGGRERRKQDKTDSSAPHLCFMTIDKQNNSAKQTKSSFY